MKRTIGIAVLGLVLLLGLVSCGPKEYIAYEIDGFCDAVERGEYVTVTGVLRVPESIMEYDRTYGLLLVEELSQDQPRVRIGIKIGTRNNQMQTLQDNFTLEDIKILTNNGEMVTHGDRVKVSGFYGGGACGLGGNSDFTADIIELP